METQPAETVISETVTTERMVPTGRWQNFLAGFASEGGRAFLAMLYEATHIFISVLILMCGLWMVAKEIEYGKEVTALAGGWLGRSMVGPIQREKQ